MFSLALQYTFIKKLTGTHSETCPEVVMDLSNKLTLQFALRHLGRAPDEEVDADVERRKDLLVDLFAEEAPPAPAPGWP